MREGLVAYWVTMKQREKLSGTLSLLLWREKQPQACCALESNNLLPDFTEGRPW